MVGAASNVLVLFLMAHDAVCTMNILATVMASIRDDEPDEKTEVGVLTTNAVVGCRMFDAA